MQKSTLVFKEKLVRKGGLLRDGVIWKVPKTDRYPDGIRYRLALVNPLTKEVLVLFDNHFPKGHHQHLRDGTEIVYDFKSVSELVDDYLEASMKEEEKNES